VQAESFHLRLSALGEECLSLEQSLHLSVAPNDWLPTIVNISHKSPVLTIFFQLDPRNPTIGGIQTCIKYVVKYAPSAFNIQLVGITDRAADVGRWQTVYLHGRSFRFLPLLQVADDNVRGWIPTTVKYAWALRQYLRKEAASSASNLPISDLPASSLPASNLPASNLLNSDFYQFHRIEPTMFTKRLRGTKLLYIHNDIYQEVKGAQKGGILWKRFPWLYFALERQLVGQFNRILSCNSESVNLYQRQYPQLAHRVSYLRNTFDSEVFYPPPEKAAARYQLAHRLNLPSSTRFILFAGRLHPQKQPLLLVQAIAQLMSLLQRSYAAKVEITPHLIIVGKGELENQMRQAVKRLGLASQVTFLGSMPQSALADLYRACDLFTLTSAYEGLARGSIEALACGTPVVTTRAGETPRFLSPDSGIVCEHATAREIARCWQTVLTRPARFPASACTRVAAPFEAKQVVEDLYGGLLTNWQRQHQRYPDPINFADSHPPSGYSFTEDNDDLNNASNAPADTLSTL